ncbi:MAG: DUF4197 domain-containing protein [Sphingobacteriales bacterium]|nr:DUF4197 domain-containing protein [Sphingobacteriales bacterium]MBI3719250.1 DUF4197 domain-containing protein [Sphingobacteriales bacterium]
MKKLLLLPVVFILMSCETAQQVLGGIANGQTEPSVSEVASGLKEALNVGAQNSAGKLSLVDGFFKDEVIKILLPQEAQKVEKTLRSLGFNKLVDDAILSINRGAEDACKTAAPIFGNAIKAMTIQDAIGILKGNDSSATTYLKNKTTVDLTNSFKPVIQQSLDKVGATKYWGDVFNTYNKLPTTFKKINPDLSGYVTERALGGLFHYVSLEEQKIRKDPVARVTDLLKKVFGSKLAQSK